MAVERLNLVEAIAAYQHALLAERLAWRELQSAKQRQHEAQANVQTAEKLRTREDVRLADALRALDRTLLNGEPGPRYCRICDGAPCGCPRGT